jgi:hypothetical protein
MIKNIQSKISIMEYNKKMEVFSNVVKFEKLFPIVEKIIPDSLVFESLNPFPGYYSDTPGSSPPLYLYLALNKFYRMEEVLRATQKIEAHFEEHFDAVKGILTIGSEETMVIRLRHFGDYNVVVPLQEAFMQQGLCWLKRVAKQVEYPALVRIVKMMEITQVEPHIYIEQREEFHGYIEIPRYLTWEQFETLTKQVKYNWFGSKFDAACGSFFYEGNLHEFVRIYSDKLDTGYLQDIRNLYLEKMIRI